MIFCVNFYQEFDGEGRTHNPQLISRLLVPALQLTWLQSTLPLSLVQSDRPRLQPGLVLLTVGPDPTKYLNTVTTPVFNLQVKIKTKKCLFSSISYVIFYLLYLSCQNY